jgi:hypothetical protein
MKVCNQCKTPLKRTWYCPDHGHQYPLQCYQSHKNRAALRGIPFLMTFEEWWGVWEQSGHWHERGSLRGQYVMARHGDKGGYEVGNVKIITSEENSREAIRHYQEGA